MWIPDASLDGVCVWGGQEGKGEVLIWALVAATKLTATTLYAIKKDNATFLPTAPFIILYEAWAAPENFLSSVFTLQYNEQEQND